MARAANRVLARRCVKNNNNNKLNDDSYVTQNNLDKIRVLALQVFEAGEKTRNAKITQKIIKAIAPNRPV